MPDSAEKPDELPTKPEDAEPLPTNPMQQPVETVRAGATMIENANNAIPMGAPETSHQNRPFTPEELNNKTKNYPELQTNDADYKTLKSYFGKIKQKIINDFNTRRPEGVPPKKKVEHGDHGSMYADLGEGEKEYILLIDETQNPQERLFKG